MAGRKRWIEAMWTRPSTNCVLMAADGRSVASANLLTGETLPSCMPAEEDEEVLIVVDEDDEPIDQMPRSTVHEKEVRHRAVHVLLANGDGQVFLQKRSDAKRTYPNRWTSSASGHVPAGESLREAARREVTEELGIEAPVLGYVGWLFIEDPEHGEREFSHLFAGVHEGGFEPDEEEVSAVETFDPHEIEERLQLAPQAFALSFRKLWEVARGPGLESDTGRLTL